MCEKCKVIRRHGRGPGHLREPAPQAAPGLTSERRRQQWHVSPASTSPARSGWRSPSPTSSASASRPPRRSAPTLGLDPNTKVRQLTDDEVNQDPRLRRREPDDRGRPAPRRPERHQAQDRDRLPPGRPSPQGPAGPRPAHPHQRPHPQGSQAHRCQQEEGCEEVTMAKPKPGGRRPRKRDRKNVSTGVVHIKSSFNNTIVSITDTEGNVHLVGVVGRGRVQGQPQEHPVRRPAGRRAGRARGHGARPAPRRGPGEGPRLRPRHRRALDPEHRHRGHVDQGRHPGAAQRLPPAEASEGLIHGSLHRSEGARLAPPRRPTSSRTRRAARRSSAARSRPAPTAARRRRNAGSEYLAQLQEKQKAKYIYGLLERQFRKTYEEAIATRARPARTCCACSRLRLDNIVYRAGWASTRPQARQFVNHGLIHVNGKRVDIAELRVRKGDVVSPVAEGRRR